MKGLGFSVQQKQLSTRDDTKYGKDRMIYLYDCANDAKWRISWGHVNCFEQQLLYTLTWEDYSRVMCTAEMSILSIDKSIITKVFV